MIKTFVLMDAKTIAWLYIYNIKTLKWLDPLLSDHVTIFIFLFFWKPTFFAIFLWPKFWSIKTYNVVVP